MASFKTLKRKKQFSRSEFYTKRTFLKTFNGYTKTFDKIRYEKPFHILGKLDLRGKDIQIEMNLTGLKGILAYTLGGRKLNKRC